MSQRKMVDEPVREEDETKMTFRAVMDEKYYTETPTTKIYAAELNSPKFISKIVKSLNDLLPIPKLQHLKRVKRIGDKFHVILNFIPEKGVEGEEEDGDGDGEERSSKKMKLNDDCIILDDLKKKGFDYEKLGIVGVGIHSVPIRGPKTRQQFEKAMEYWPVNFHPEKKIETMLSERIFDESEREYHLDNMKRVLKMSENENGKNVAMIVDFKERRIIAWGCDRVEVHPLQHAVMVAIDVVARTNNGGAWDLPYDELTFDMKNATLNHESSSMDKVKLKAGEVDDDDDDEAPYLCTGYDLYVAKEPCVMCAMSLVHSRIKRVFFHVRNPERGALASACHVHTIKDLNHHYEVFEFVKAKE
ncbi:cytidine and deoxycytidylate deaminase zinc-binding region, putative [Pediculus humanus corporis]|uniref:Cytidine and deoxycytidylate deaminase zinc-binding region, putative n=1 Tax=Pediculus humanus subsp. corporis TaxID=121224 RepID=E0VJV7_PEDHC|nr:cytidine and deoxycytidylate deaminase zinc-binding region, putative [Pediculus humanus corporis]EEB13663.1 cytidine and deoxycytidylate deaminase zinc-binding region, putative [Pediculus humanus corporis]